LDTGDRVQAQRPALDGGFSLTCPSAHDRVVMRNFAGIGLAALAALVVAGFILGGYLDATGATSIAGLPWLMHQAQPLRIVFELVIGLQIEFGADHLTQTGAMPSLG
jgi:hypothetical protein